MASLWRFSIGNVLQRAASTPVAVDSTVSASYPLTAWGDRFADVQGGWDYNGDGVYKADIDTNLLALTTTRSDAPYGFADLQNALAGTPGLPANPIESGSFGGRTALKLYRRSYQNVLVMPGETVTVVCGLYRPTASSATKAAVRVMDMATGKVWHDAAWSAGTTDEQATVDTWKDVSVAITADTKRLQPALYRVIIGPEAASYGADSYVYVSAPALIPEVDLLALVGHNVPLGTTATLVSGGTTWSLADLTGPVYSFEAETAASLQTWRLTLTLADPLADAPMIGEVWLGKARDFTTCPLMGVQIAHSQAALVTGEGASGRKNIWNPADMGNRTVSLGFGGATGAGYSQFRDELYQGTRGGTDPLLLIGEDFDTFLTIFGLLDPAITFKRSGPTRWAYESKVYEAPRWNDGSRVLASA